MKHLCVDCDFMDQASRAKWSKVKAVWDSMVKTADENGVYCDANPPTFDTWKPHCTHESAKRQPVTDAVAGTHLDGPPYLTCRERRKQCPVICRDFTERKET